MSICQLITIEIYGDDLNVTNNLYEATQSTIISNKESEEDI